MQQIANNAARATIAGLTTAERTAIANQAVTRGGQAQGSLIAARLGSSVTDDSGYTTVVVRYDAFNIALLRTGIVPVPGTMIERRALIRNGGMS